MNKSMLIIKKILILLTLTLFPSIIFAGEITLNKDKNLCGILFSRYSDSIVDCNESLSNCIENGMSALEDDIIKYDLYKISENHYGYTYVLGDTVSGTDNYYSWVHLLRYKSLRGPTLLETWLIKTKYLKNVTAIPPGPIKYYEPRKQMIGLNIDINSIPFRKLLKQSKKISDILAPLYHWGSRNFYLDNNFTVEWLYGGDFHASSISNASIIELFPNGDTSPLCKFNFSK